MQEAALAAVRELREGGAAWVYLECCSAEYSSSAYSLDSNSPSSHSSEPARARAGTVRPFLTPQPSPSLTWSRVRRNTTGVGRRNVQLNNNVENVYTVNFMDLHGLQRQNGTSDKDRLDKDRLDKDGLDKGGLDKGGLDRLDKDGLDKDRLDRLDKDRLNTDCCVTSPLLRRAGRMAVERKRRVDTTVRWTSWRDPGTAESAV